MNIILLAKNFEKYKSGYYHQDIINAFKRKANCYLYGEGYPKYKKGDTIEDVIVKSPFDRAEVDLIVASTSWEMENPKVEESDHHPKINLSKLDIPKIFFLNKEYKKLEKKLEYAKRNNFDYVFTVHHAYKKWAEQTGLSFVQLPFAADPERFKDYGLPEKYDFGFTGALHKSYTDIRYRIKCRLFKNPEVKSNFGISVLFKKNPLKERFKKYKIYWAEWGARRISGRSLLPSGAKYARFLNSFKTFLSTPSATGIVGTRYFECMAVKTLLFCPESGYYEGMFKDGYNCVTFKEDISDFEEKFEYVLSNERERKRIVENAYGDFINNHTYDNRIEKVLNMVKQNLKKVI